MKHKKPTRPQENLGTDELVEKIAVHEEQFDAIQRILREEVQPTEALKDLLAESREG